MSYSGVGEILLAVNFSVCFVGTARGSVYIVTKAPGTDRCACNRSKRAVADLYVSVRI
jgi:hypothetical protein